MWWLNKKCLHVRHLNTWSLVGCAIWEGLGASAWWRMYVTGGRLWEENNLTTSSLLSLFCACGSECEASVSASATMPATCSHAIPTFMDSKPSRALSPINSFFEKLSQSWCFIMCSQVWWCICYNPRTGKVETGGWWLKQDKVQVTLHKSSKKQINQLQMAKCQSFTIMNVKFSSHS